MIVKDRPDPSLARRAPGLPPALMIGFQAGQALSFALGKPFIGINHHEAHLYSPWIRSGRAECYQIEPNVSLIVSGGKKRTISVDQTM